MNLSELIKKQGIELTKNISENIEEKKPIKKRPPRRPWLEVEDTPNLKIENDSQIVLKSEHEDVSQTLDKRETDVIQTLDVSQTLERREIDVNQTLDKLNNSNQPKTLQTQTLDKRETDVIQTLDVSQALERREIDVNQTLDKLNNSNQPKTPQTQTLNKRETDVIQTLDVNQALDSHNVNLKQTLCDESLHQYADPNDLSNNEGLKPNKEECTAVESISSNKMAFSQTLDSHLTDVKQTLNRRQSGVNETLDSHNINSNHVNQALNKTLNSREIAVNTVNTEALEISHLIGNEKELVLLVCGECRKIGSLETNYISNEELTSKIPLDANGLRNLVHRVKNKGYFSVKTKSLGKTALRKFTVPKNVYQQLNSQTLDKPTTDVRQMLDKALNKTLEIPSSSSSILNISKTTTSEIKSDDFALPPEWEKIDISDLDSARFSKADLLKIYKAGKANPEVVEQSLTEFRHDLNIYKKHGLRNPRAAIMGILLEGAPYTSADPEYEPEYIKAKKRSLATLKKREELSDQLDTEVERNKNLPMEQEKTARFEKWLSTLTFEQRRQFAPQATIDGSEMQKGLLRSQWEKSEQLAQ